MIVVIVLLCVIIFILLGFNLYYIIYNNMVITFYSRVLQLMVLNNIKGSAALDQAFAEYKLAHY